MPKKKIITMLAASAVLACGGGATAYGLSNEISIDNKGEVTKVRTFDTEVSEILAAQDINVEDAEKVTPAVTQTVAQDKKIVIEELATVNITVDDGYENVILHTEAQTVEQALTEAGYEITNQKVTPSLDTELVTGETTNITVENPVKVTFVGMNGEMTTEDIFLTTVGEAADEYLKDYNKDTDELSPSRDTVLTQSMTVEITRNRENEKTETEDIPFEKKTVKSDDLYEGEEKVTTKGVKGELTKTIKETVVDGEVVDEEVVKEETTKKPVTEVTTVGTKEKVVEEEKEEDVASDSSNDEETDSSSASDSDSSDSSEDSSSSSSTQSSSSSSDTSGSSSSSGDSSSGSSGSNESSSSSSSDSSSGSGLLAGIPQSKIDRFDKLAQCESGGNWSINTGNSFYGGLQHTYGTWLAYGGGEFAQTADKATREQQIYIANKVQKGQGWGAWPSCSSKYGFI